MFLEKQGYKRPLSVMDRGSFFMQEKVIIFRNSVKGVRLMMINSSFPRCATCWASFIDGELEDLNDELFIIGKCRNGHVSRTLIQSEKFDYLFNAGCDAYFNKDFMSSILYIYSGVERYHEYFYKIIYLSKNIKADELENTSKLVTKRSERELGAFYFAHLLEFNKAPSVLNMKITKLRNDVIHKGKIPNSKETYEFIKGAHDYILETKNIIDSKKYEEIRINFTFDRFFKIKKENPNIPEITSASASILDTHLNESFEKKLSHQRKRWEFSKTYTKEQDSIPMLLAKKRMEESKK